MQSANTCRRLIPSFTICLLLQLALGLLLIGSSQAQNDTGIHPYETYDGARENINLGSGNVFVSLPILTLTGRNGHNYSVSLVSNSQTWLVSAGAANIGMVLSRAGTTYFHPSGTTQPVPNVTCLTGYSMSDENGGGHSFSNILSDCVVSGGGPNQGQRMPQYEHLASSDDRGEGIVADLNACEITFPNGSWIPLQTGTSGCPIAGIAGTNGGGGVTLIDSNGNQIGLGAGNTNNCSGWACGGADIFPNGSDTDTVGRSVNFSSTNHTIQYYDSNGAQRTITFGIQTLSLSSCVVVKNGVSQALSGTPNLITSARLPNGLTYIFHYDQCGNMDKVVYPSGGYTRYVFDYANYLRSIPGQAGTFTDFELTARYVCRAPSGSPGATSISGDVPNGQRSVSTCSGAEDRTTYSPTVGGQANSANQVTDPLGNLIKYQFATCGSYPYTFSCETSRQIYQGTSTLLRTVQTTYSGYYPASETTTLSNGLQSRVEWDYWTLDFVKEEREFSWGQGSYGPLLRKTDSGQGYCNGKRPSEIVYDGSGNQIASTTYEFDNYTAGISLSGAAGLTSPTGPRCNVTAIQRWRNTDGASLTTRMQYDDAGNVLSVTDPLGHITKTSYADSWGNTGCIPIGKAAAYPSQVTDALGHITKRSFNSCTGTAASATDANSQVTNFSYDLMDRLMQTTLPDTGQTSTCFSEVSGGSCYSSAYPLKVVATQKINSSLNKVSTAVLDGLARITQTQLNSDSFGTTTYVDTTYDGAEQKSTVSNPYHTTSDATYGISTYNYDGLGRVIKVIPPDGGNVTTSYDTLPVNGSPLNNCTIVTDQAGKQRRSCSDALGRLMEVDEPGNNPVPGTPGTGSFTISGSEQSTQYVCGPNGQLCTLYDAGAVTATVNGTAYQQNYSQSDTNSTIASGLAAKINAGSAVAATANGSLISMMAKANGSITNYTLSSSVSWNQAKFTNPSYTAVPSGATMTGGTDGSSGTGSASINSPLVTVYQYDMLNNLLRVDQKGSAPGDSSQWRTRTFTYNSLSQLVCAANPEIAQVTCPASAASSFPAGAVTYGYDNDGNLTTKTSPKPNQTNSSVTVATTYTYDAGNRLTQKSYSDGTTQAAQFFYDIQAGWGVTQTNIIGRLTEATAGTSPRAAEIFSYDPMGRVTLNNQCTPSNCGTNAFPVSYTYDLAGNMTSGSNGEGFTISYRYDSATRPTAVTSNFVDAQHPGTLLTVQGYSPDGAMTQMAYGNGLLESRGYNNRLQPAELKSYTSTGFVRYDFTYGYNSPSNNGNVVSWNSTGWDFIFNRSYAYDALNRLSTMSDSAAGQGCKGLQWSYDAWGNRTAQTVTSGSCFSSSAAATTQNRLVGYQYDAAGNMTYDGTHSYTYDAENRIVQVDGGLTATYVYDAEGRRAEKITGGAWRDYIRDLGGNVVSEASASGWQIGYVYLRSSLIAQYQNSTTYFMQSDHLGSTRLMTGADGSGQQSWDYLPYGELLQGVLSTNHLFTGKERDAESGLDNFGARYDASSLGRFMSPDPLLSSGTVVSPQSWNRFAYALNNPLRFTDPTGLWDWDESAGGSASDDDLRVQCAHGRDRKTRNAAKRALRFRQKFREALDAADEAAGSSRLSEDQQSAAQAAVDAYGSEGDDNGVTVGVQKGNGATTKLNDDDTFSVKFGSGNKGNFLTATVLHEGVHIDQGNAWLNGGESSVADINHYFRERQAWTLEGSVASVLGMKSLAPHGGGKDFQVWNRGWKAADVETMRSRGVATIMNYMNLKPSDADTYSSEHHHKEQ